jgi:signal transduction histidine kinase
VIELSLLQIPLGMLRSRHRFKKHDAKTAIIRYMSHELLTPLNSAVLGVKLIINMLMDSDDPTDQEVFDNATDVTKALAHAVQLVDSLTLYDKIESGIMVLQKENVNLFELLEETVLPFVIKARNNGVDVSVSTSPDDVSSEGGRGVNEGSSGRSRRRSTFKSKEKGRASSGKRGSVERGIPDKGMYVYAYVCNV